MAQGGGKYELIILRMVDAHGEHHVASCLERFGISESAAQKLLRALPGRAAAGDDRAALVLLQQNLQALGVEAVVLETLEAAPPPAFLQTLRQRSSPGQLAQAPLSQQAGASHAGRSPDYSEPVLKAFHRGNELMSQCRFHEAKAAFLDALSIEPGCVEAVLNLGNALVSLEEYAEAKRLYEQAAADRPEFGEAHYNLGNLHMRFNRAREAAAAYEAALQRKADNVDSMLGLAAAYQQLQRTEEAVELYHKVLKLEPRSARAWLHLGNAFFDKKDYDEAEQGYLRFLALRPDGIEGYFNLANTYRAKSALEAAAVAYKQALAIEPDFIPALLNLANTLLAMDRLEEGIEQLQRILAVSPNHYEALNNLGNAYFAARRPALGIECYQKAIALRDQENDAHWNQSLTLLLQGRYQEGWKEFEWRLKRGEHRRSFSRPAWDGTDIAGKILFVYLEQGYGDCLHCVRYVRLLLERGVRVILECRASLERLFRSIEGVELLHEKDSPPKEFDYHAAIMSLPHLMGTTLETVPAEVPYLKAPADLSAELHLPDRGRPRIGFVWKGNPHQGNDRFRSASLQAFLPLLDISGVDYYCLQKMLTPEEEALLSRREYVALLGDKLNDWADTAAVVDQLDLLLSVDTGIAHLAGALNRPVWLLLCRTASWQWLLERTDSPWYPSARLFRQERLGDWSNVTAEVLAALRVRYPQITFPPEPTDSGLLEEALYHFAGGHLHLAQDALEKLTGDDRLSPEVLHLKARILFAGGAAREAVAALAEAAVLEPDNAVILNDLASLHCALGNNKTARLLYERAVKKDPTCTEARANFAHFAFLAGDYSTASKHASRVLELDPRHPQAHLVKSRLASLRRRTKTAIRHLEQIVEANLATLEVLEELGALYFATGEIDSGIRMYEKALEVQPHELSPYLALATRLQQTSRHETALRYTERAAQISPHCVEVHRLRSSILHALGRLNEAEEQLCRALIAEPRNAELHLALARVLEEKGQTEEALAGARQCMRLENCPAAVKTAALELQARLCGLRMYGPEADR